MKKLLTLSLLVWFAFCGEIHIAEAQIMPCANITVQAYPLNPQSGPTNFFGVQVTLDQAYDQDITVTGYIYDAGDSNTNTPFGVVIPAGSLTAETSAELYQTTAADAGTTTGSISPSTVTANGLSYTTQSYITGVCPYDNFDGQFNGVGSFHNSMLQNVVASYYPSPTVTTYEGAIDDVNNFLGTTENTYYSSWFTSAGSDTAEANSDNQSSKYYADYSGFENNCLSTTGPNSFDSAEARIASIPDFDNSNKSLYNQIIASADSGLSGLMTIDQYESSLDNLANVWTSLNSGSPSTAGAQLTGSILSIGLHSIEFWRQNMDQLYTGGSSWVQRRYDRLMAYSGHGPNMKLMGFNRVDYFIAAWVAADIAGAVIGAGTSAISQYASSGHIKAGGVLVAAGVGAISGSTGLVSRVASFISKFF